MKKIPLTQGKFALVDDEDFEYLSQWKWYAKKTTNRRGFYAVRTDTSNGRKNTKAVVMHRFLMKETDPTILIDHRDNDSLNNQKHNLRAATYTENAQNRRSKVNSASKFLGVYKMISTGKSKRPDGSVFIKNYGQRWCGIIMVNKKRIYSPRFPFTPCGELAAAAFYDDKAKKYFGEFANLNFK